MAHTDMTIRDIIFSETWKDCQMKRKIYEKLPDFRIMQLKDGYASGKLITNSADWRSRNR